MDPLADFTPSINPYHYCYNNPIRFTDPTGMWVEDGSNYIASIFVDEDGKVIEHRDDGDARVYLVTDAEAWIKGGKKKDGLDVLGYEDPTKDYQPGDQYTFYQPFDDPKYAGANSKDADEYWKAIKKYYYDLGYYDEEGNPLYDIYGNPVAGYYPDGPMSYLSAFALANIRYAPQWYMAGSEPTLWGEAVVGASAILYGTWIWYDSFAKSKPGKAKEVEGSEHTSGARKSTQNKHQQGQTRKQQVNRDKKRQKSNWKQR